MYVVCCRIVTRIFSSSQSQLLLWLTPSIDQPSDNRNNLYSNFSFILGKRWFGTISRNFFPQFFCLLNSAKSLYFQPIWKILISTMQAKRRRRRRRKMELCTNASKYELNAKNKNFFSVFAQWEFQTKIALIMSCELYVVAYFVCWNKQFFLLLLLHSSFSKILSTNWGGDKKLPSYFN